MHFSEIIAAIALLFGAVLGLAGMFAPDWAAKTVRLVPDPDPAMTGGYSEFRATYGGLFLFSHLMTLVLVLNTPPVLSLVAAMPLAMGWLGAATGRVMSLVMDRDKNRGTGPLPVWMLIELAMGVAIALPILQFKSLS
jgi:Domain of unknown function (DUF4345)